MNRSLTGIFLASAFISIFIYSCTKIDSTDLGIDLIPAVDNINTFQTVLDIETDNQLMEDSTRMYLQEEANHAIGIIENDPEFGRTDAALYFTTEPVSFKTYPFLKKDTVFIDSVVLSLSYAGLYGDSTSVQQFEVRELDNDFPFKGDTSYRINVAPFPTYPQVLGSKLVNFTTLNDSVVYANSGDTVKTTNELRINLDTEFGRRFVEYDTTNAYKDHNAFKSVFKGFEVKINEGASPSKKALAYFNIQDNAKTKLTFYCRVMRNGVLDTINPMFVFASTRDTVRTYFDPHANIVKRTPSGNYLANVTNGNTNDELIYLQTSPGSFANLKIPGIDTLTNRVVHLAELIVEKIPSQDENIYTPPSVLFLDAINAAGDTAFTIRNDFVPSSEDPGYDIRSFGGIYQKNGYKFNLTRYLQGIVTKNNPSYTLRVYAPYISMPFYMAPTGALSSTTFSVFLNRQLGAGRVVVGGGAHPTHRMRLRIIYSKI